MRNAVAFANNDIVTIAWSYGKRPDGCMGFAVYRIDAKGVETPLPSHAVFNGDTSFELPLATRAPTAGKFQGLSQSDVLYFIMPDRFANGDPTNDQPADAPGSWDRSEPRAYHGGDLRGIREHLPYLKDLGVTTLWLTPILKNGATQDYHGYGAVDLYAVDPHLGSLQDYQELVTDAHRHGHQNFLRRGAQSHWPESSVGEKSAVAGLVSRHCRAAHQFQQSPLSRSFYGKTARRSRRSGLF